MLRPEQERYLKNLLAQATEQETFVDRGLLWSVVLIYKHLLGEVTIDDFYHFMINFSREAGVSFTPMYEALEEMVEDQYRDKSFAKAQENKLSRHLLRDAHLLLSDLQELIEKSRRKKIISPQVIHEQLHHVVNKLPYQQLLVLFLSTPKVTQEAWDVVVHKAFPQTAEKRKKTEITIQKLFANFFARQTHFWFLDTYREMICSNILSVEDVVNILQTIFGQVIANRRIAEKIEAMTDGNKTT